MNLSTKCIGIGYLQASTIFMYKGMCRSKELPKIMCARALPKEEQCFLPSSYADQILEKIKASKL